MEYIHKETGSVDTKEGWIASYDADELAERGVTAEQAFDADLDKTIIAIEEPNTITAQQEQAYMIWEMSVENGNLLTFEEYYKHWCYENNCFNDMRCE